MRGDLLAKYAPNYRKIQNLLLAKVTLGFVSFLQIENSFLTFINSTNAKAILDLLTS